MKRPESIPVFSKALLAGVLTGIGAAIINCVYNVIFRGVTRFFKSEEFGFFQIIFASIIVLMLVGMLLYVFLKNANMAAFVVTVIIISIVCVCITGFFHSDKTESAFYGNHGLIAGFIILGCLLSITLLPYLYRHPKIFI